MNNNQLIERKESIFTKIKNFFLRKFGSKNKSANENIVVQNVTETKENNVKTYEDDKKEFLQLYEDSKNGKIDLLSLSPEILEKMCILLEEEIKIKEKNNDMKRAKLSEY